MVFPVVMVRLWELHHKEGRMPKNWCLQTMVLEKTPESLLDSKIKPVNLKGDQPLNIHWKDWCWSWSSGILVVWCEQMTHWKSPWCWEGVRAEGEEGIRGRDGWTASSVQWTWTWANSQRLWGSGKPGMLQSTEPHESDTTEWLNNSSTKGRPPLRLIWCVDYVRIEALVFLRCLTKNLISQMSETVRSHQCDPGSHC